MPSAAVLGCAGYAGQETLDRVLSHPVFEVLALGSDSHAGEPASALDPRLDGAVPAFVTNEEALASGADVVFACLGHAEAAALEPPSDSIVVDLSGAHRFVDATVYAQWYGFEHPHPWELETWSYALPELFPPTGPLADALEPESVVVDAKSGVSGAGREPKAATHAGSVLDNLAAYRVGTHQHAPEIAAQLGFPVCFVPHLVPLRRGLLVTCYAQARHPDLRERLEDAYDGAPAVRVLAAGSSPDLARVQGTDAAEIALFEDAATGRAIVVCALDNLGKGAAGQAVQNANLALGID